MPDVTTLDVTNALDELAAISQAFQVAHDGLADKFEQLEGSLIGDGGSEGDSDEDDDAAGDGPDLDSALADLEEALEATEESIATILFWRPSTRCPRLPKT